jgi:signal transduction histidine kinase
MSIRLKVILPYLILTLLVAVIGVYVVTRLVSNTLSERLTNQLLDSGRAVSDSFVRLELNHVDQARIIAYTTGLAEALQTADRETALSIAMPVASGLGIENVILITPDGRELVHLLLDEDGKLIRVDEYTGAEQSPIVKPYLTNQDEEEPPHRALGLNLVNEKYYYYTAIPVPFDKQFAGVVVVGTSIDTILPGLKSTVLADVIMYGGNGEILGSTLVPGVVTDSPVENLSPDEFGEVISADDLVTGQNFSVDGRWYRLARGPLQIGDDRIGVFAVALPLNFVIQSTVDNRTNYVILFTAVMLVVIGIGYGITRLITTPLSKLVNTSQAIAGGKLDERTGIRSRDEIGKLAVTFDSMTDRLQERTVELEQTNEMLKKMDRTKGNFIQISAHELRTPLTLIMGYAQMLELQAKGDPELVKLAKGILDGSERMTDVVNNMLDVSRIDNNTLNLKKTSLRLDQVISKVHRTFAPDLKTRNITFNVKGIKELPVIPADAEMIQKVFYHMIMNSIKYTPDGGSVDVSGQYKNGVEVPHVEIAIRDTGIGIDPASIPMLFNKFYQTGDVMLHSSGKTKFKGGGLGLGLVIARGIVEAHGGKIRVESPGHDETNFPGSTFYVSLPVEKKSEGQS